MKKYFLVMTLIGTSIAYADNLPQADYIGSLSEHTSSWSWATAVTGSVDGNSFAKVTIPPNPHLANLPGTLTATITVSGNSCTSPDAKVQVGQMTADVTLSNCGWDGANLNTDYTTASIAGFVITGHATLTVIKED